MTVPPGGAVGAAFADRGSIGMIYYLIYPFTLGSCLAIMLGVLTAG